MRRIFLNYYLFLLAILLLGWFVAVPLVEHFAAAPFRGQFTRYYREVIRGPMHLLVTELERVPPAERQRRLAALQPEFGFPLALVPLGDGGLSPAQQAELEAGKIVVGAGYDRFWRRLGDSGQVLALGPLPSPGVGGAVDLLIWVLILFALALATALWALPFWRQLTGLGRTAVAFGEGDLEVRAALPRHSALAPLATAFNRMAERIGQLITSHQELTNAVSHELRTPIARLRFGLEMAASAADAAARERYLAGIRSDLDALEELVAELLSYARYDRTAPTLQLRETAIVPWLREVATGLAAAPDRPVELEIRVEEGARACFEPHHLARALTNLVQNAARYGRGRVRVTLERLGEDWLLRVDDDGPGIPEDERQRIFEPFARLETSRSRESGGHGLGLAIVRRVLERHGGGAEVSVSPLGGSRFTLRWPAAAPGAASHRTGGPQPCR